MKAKNLKEFKALIKRYESITIEEIKKVFNSQSMLIANRLTGYGDEDDCGLCKYINTDDEYNCEGCVYVIATNCLCSTGKNKKTYKRIGRANTPLKLFNAYRARAKHMKTLIS